MEEREFEDVVERLLTVGVPPTAIAKAFEVDVFVIKEKLSGMRVERYGAAELAEAMGQLQWDALERVKDMMDNAPYNQRSKLITGILGRTMSLTARQSPETMGNVRVELLDLYAKMGSPDDDFAGTDTGAFVALAADASVEADENQDQGSLRHSPGPG